MATFAYIPIAEMANPVQQGLKLNPGEYVTYRFATPKWLIQYNKDWNTSDCGGAAFDSDAEMANPVQQGLKLESKIPVEIGAESRNG